MKTYNALIKKNQEGKITDFLLLKEGFSFTAFLFSALWFLYHKMPKEFFVLSLINIIFAFAQKISFLSGENKFILEIAFFFIVAINANYWFANDLEKKGYEFVGVVFGDNLASAKIRFIENLKADNLLDKIELTNFKA
ncbi:MAG: DUF2628 domain-containing protein [Rickettsiales bacterium]|nr:DUF2628 domain-containing protein [Rickettsiales bacterium]